jgi:hypothetical protein
MCMGEDEEPLAADREAELEEAEHDVEMDEDAHAMSSGSVISALWSLHEEDKQEREIRERTTRILGQEVGEYTTLAEAIEHRPQDRVEVFDFLGARIGLGLLQGTDPSGHPLVFIASDMIDVAARAEGPNGPIGGAVFALVHPDPPTDGGDRGSVG